MNKKLLASLIAGIITALIGFNFNIILLLTKFGVGFTVTLVSILTAEVFK